DDHPVNLAIARTGARVLGVCLGMQAIAQAFGGRVVPARRLVHGLTSRIHHDGSGVLARLPSPFPATRYHSLAVETDLPVTAWTADGTVMALRHPVLPVEGVQFHPESVRSEHGYDLLRNWLRT